METFDVQKVQGELLEMELVKEAWTTAYINSLPDSAFLYISPGGKKDGEGKTVPRSLRHFPVRDANGKVDLPHVRNALSRIPQSNVPQSAKDSAMATAKRLLSQHGGAQKAGGGMAAGPKDGRGNGPQDGRGGKCSGKEEKNEKAAPPAGSKVQSILFPVGKYTVEQACSWLESHGYKTGKVDTTEQYHRFRQSDPGQFKRLRTIAAGTGGIKLIVGWK